MSQGPLVLSRRVGEKISVEHGFLMVEVIEIRRGQVKLKFTGDVSVWRAEVEELRNEKKRKLALSAMPCSELDE